MKVKYYVLASLPPPYNGQNIGTKLMLEVIENEYSTRCFKWNISWYPTDNATKKEKLKYYLNAFIKYFRTIISVWHNFYKEKPTKLYIVPSGNLKGIFRDLLFYLPFLLHKKEIVCHIRNGSFQTNQGLFSYLYKRKNFKFIFLTNLLAENSGVQKNKFKVIPNFVDKLFDTTDSVRKVIKGDSIRIVFLSNLFASKGIFSIINAVKKVGREYSVVLDIYGKGEQKVVNQVINEIKDYSFINFHGEISDRGKVKQILHSSDVFALPTTYNVEASPRSIIEAMSQNCVPLVTNHAGIPDMVDERDSYMIDKNKDINDQLVNTLKIIANSISDLNIKKLDARKSYEKKFSYSVIENNILEYLD